MPKITYYKKGQHKEVLQNNPVSNNITKMPDEDLEPPKERGDRPKSKKDGKSIEIHHEGQNPNGPFREMTRTDHRLGDNYKINHPKYNDPSKISRPTFDKYVKDYWAREWDLNRWGNIPIT